MEGVEKTYRDLANNRGDI